VEAVNYTEQEKKTPQAVKDALKQMREGKSIKDMQGWGGIKVIKK